MILLKCHTAGDNGVWKCVSKHSNIDFFDLVILLEMSSEVIRNSHGDLLHIV